MIVFGLVMAAQWDLKFQTWIADDLPAVVVNPTRDLESSDASIERLAELRSGHFSEEATQIASGAAAVQDGREQRVRPAGDRSGPRVPGNPAVVQHTG